MTVLTEETKPVDRSLHTTTFAERLESLKVGCFGGLAATIGFGATVLPNQVLARSFELAALEPGSLWILVAKAAIAILSGFLFAVTYRYVIRRDRNPHLRSGAVMAFGLVRGLAQLEAGLQTQIAVLPAVLLLGESVALFAIVRLVLDGAIDRAWVKPFS